MIVISDTTAITNLWKIGQLHLLKSLFQEIVIPEAVQSELYKIASQEASLAHLDWIKVERTTRLDVVEMLLAALDLGEAQAIALYLEKHADYLIIDENNGRLQAKALGVNTIGILGILIMAKRQTLIDAAKPLLDQLIEEANFFVKPDLYHEVLKQVNEAF